MMQVPFFDLTRQWKDLGSIAPHPIEEAVRRVMRSGKYILGDEVEAFENELADYCEVKHAAGVASGTDALELALRAKGRECGDTIRVPVFTFGATLSAIVRAVLWPRLRDIDENFLMKCKMKTPAMTVCLYGQKDEAGPGDIEDMAQGIGLPVTGDAACLSFFPTKNLGCYGDGGAVLTNSDEIAEKVRMLRVHGCERKYHHEMVGTNSRLDAIQAAILRVKLKHLDKWTERRREIAERYTDGLKDVEGIICPVAVREHVWNQYTVRIPTDRRGITQCNMRDEVKGILAEKGIGTAIYYPEPLHTQPAFAHLGYKEGDFPNAEKACREVLSLPIFPELTDAEQDHVIGALKEVFA